MASQRLRVVIHGGMHKTGTTSLQEMLGAHRTGLLAHGICYPVLEPSHHGILNAKRDNWEPTGCFDALAQAERSGAATLILSSEVVSTLSAEQFVRLTACFGALDLTYFFCFRHWWDYWPSRWAQNCVRRDTQTLAAYRHTVMQHAGGHPDYRFDTVMDRAAASGPCRVAAVSYDNAMKTDNSVAPALLRAMGVPDSLAVDLVSDQTRLNARADPLLIELCRLLNGIAGDRLDLPQDDLCRSIGEHRQCRGFFDLMPRIGTMDARRRQDMLDIVAGQAPSTLPNPDVGPALHALTTRYGPCFVNRIDGRIFCDPPAASGATCPMVWQDLLALTNGQAATVLD